MKTCPKCKNPQPFDQFNKSKQSKDGLTCYCKTCLRAYSKKYFEKNRDTVLAKNRINYEKTHEVLALTRKKYYEENKDSYIKRYKSYLADPVKKKIRNDKAAIRDKNRRKTDVNYKLRRNLRTRIWHALKGFSKSRNTEALLGCSINELKSHLESLFKTGMSWDNYGKWHVDHINACATFDLSCPIQQAKCFHFSNLQPLWAIENIKKGSTIPQSR